MKILKHGVKKKAIAIYNVDCKHCGCVIELDEMELTPKKYDFAERDPIVGFYTCPDCKQRITVRDSNMTRREERIIGYYKDEDGLDVTQELSATVNLSEKERFRCPNCGGTEYEIGNFGDPMFNDIFKIECTNCDYVGPDVGCSDYGEALIMYNDYMKEHKEESDK